MASINKVILVGNCGRDPELRHMPSGDAMCNLAVATTDKWKDKASGEQKEQTEWHRVAMFGKLAEIAGQYLKKGSQVYIEGKLRTRKWQDKDGVEKYTTEIIADTMQMLGNRQNGSNDNSGYAPRENNDRPAPAARPAGNTGGGGAAPTASGRPAPNFSDMDDDIPFVADASLMDVNRIEF